MVKSRLQKDRMLLEPEEWGEGSGVTGRAKREVTGAPGQGGKRERKQRVGGTRAALDQARSSPGPGSALDAAGTCWWPRTWKCFPGCLVLNGGVCCHWKGSHSHPRKPWNRRALCGQGRRSHSLLLRGLHWPPMTTAEMLWPHP